MSENERRELENLNASKMDSTSEAEKNPSWTTSKTKIYTSLIALSLSWTFLFTAFFSIAHLQSTLNSDSDLGTTSLALVYSLILFACFFFPSFVMNLVGLKWGIVLSQIAYLTFVSANLYPRWLTLVPGICN